MKVDYFVECANAISIYGLFRWSKSNYHQSVATVQPNTDLLWKLFEGTENGRFQRLCYDCRGGNNAIFMIEIMISHSKASMNNLVTWCRFGLAHLITVSDWPIQLLATTASTIYGSSK